MIKLKIISISRTLEERAIRLFQTKGKRLQDLDPSLFSKSQSAGKKTSYALVLTLDVYSINFNLIFKFKKRIHREK